MNARRLATWFALLALLVLAGCSPLERAEQPQQGEWVDLTASHSLGQTFTARYAGLQTIELYLRPAVNTQGVARLHLRSVSPLISETPDADLATAELALSQVEHAGYFNFTFTPQPYSAQADYYFWLELPQGSQLQAASGPGAAYLNGALYQDGISQDRQLTFRLVYDRQQAFTGLAGEMLNWLGWLIAGLWLFVLPGWGWLRLVWPGWQALRWPEKLGLASGFSLALYPLLFLWTALVGLHLGGGYAWLPPVSGLIAWAVSVRPWRAKFLWPQFRRELKLDRYQRDNLWPDLAFLGVLTAVVFVRLWSIRGLEIPMFGDSVQHSMITQLLIDHGGLFSSWLPYAQMTTLTYHFGFHTLAAVFSWLTGLPVPYAVLWTGQILNILAVISLVPLAVKLGHNAWAGVFALLVAGLLAQMPMFYVNWGRYTQLAGQVILPVMAYLAWDLLASRRWDRRLVLLTGLASAGLALSHYRILIFGVIFVGVAFISYLRQVRLRTLLAHALAAGSLGLLMFLPWFVHIYGGKIASLFVYHVSTPAGQSSEFIQQSNSLGDLFTFLPPWMWLSLPVVAGWGLWRRERGTGMISLWWLLNLVAANPQWLSLPGAGVITSFTTLLGAYIPAGILFGSAAGWLAVDWPAWSLAIKKPAPSRPQWAGLSGVLPLVLLLLAAGLSLYGARQRLRDVQPANYALATRPDQRAAAWIQENTPQSAIFLVNSFFAFNNSLIVGSDGGWWLPQLARRATNLPPINYSTEQGPQADYRQWVNALPATILQTGLDSPQTLKMLAERGIRYVYLGQQQGRVNSAGPALDPQTLSGSPYYTPIYHQDRVWIFHIEAP